MPNYHYICKCEYEFEVYQSIKEESLTQCPQCNLALLERVIYAVPVLVEHEAKTIGLQAERNTNKLGHHTREEMWGQQAAHKIEAKRVAREELETKLPQGASLPKVKSVSNKELAVANKIKNMTEDQKRNYIING